MEREQRHFHSEGSEKSEEKPERSGSEVRNLASADRVLDRNKIEAADFGVEPQNCCQHEYRRNHRKQEEFDGSVDPPFVPEDADEQGHGDQRGFPEEIEEEQIKRSEHADQCRLQHQQQDKELLHPIVNTP